MAYKCYCDACNEDITEQRSRWKTVKLEVGMDDTYHFCNVQCLRNWTREQEQREAKQ